MSDILQILENIDAMLQCYTKMVNGIAANLQLVAVAVEAQSLATKLNLSAERWRYQLPFKEACDVDFMYWFKRMGRWINELSGFVMDINQEKMDYFEPELGYFVDQYYYINSSERVAHKCDGFRPFFMYKEGKQYNLSLLRCQMQIKIDKDKWKSKIDNAAIDEIIEYLSGLDERINKSDLIKAHNYAEVDNASKMKKCISMIKNGRDLVDSCILHSIEQLFGSLHKVNEVLLCPEEMAYKRLYERLSASYFDKHIEDARNSFQGWLSKTPKKRRLKMLKEKMEEEKAKFFCGKWKEALENYFDIEKELEGTDAGMFIFKYRRELTLEEVGQIVGQYHKMACILGEISRLESKAEAKSAAKHVEAPQEVKTMELPQVFASWTRQSVRATNMLVDIIRELAKTTGLRSKKLSGGKSWGHVKQALINAEFIDTDCSGAEFGKAIADICPDKKQKNIEQMLKSYNMKKKGTLDENIVADIEKRLKAVKGVNVNC